MFPLSPFYNPIAGQKKQNWSPIIALESKILHQMQGHNPFDSTYPPGGVLPYISHIGMCRPKRWGFAPFWSGIGYGFRGNYGSVWTYLSFQLSKKEREICEFEMDVKKSFWCCANLNNFLQARYENGRGFLGQVGKRVWKMTGFGLKQGQDLEVEPSTL